jgi:membrane-associated HD superfamily phosphohydrolase
MTALTKKLNNTTEALRARAITIDTKEQLVEAHSTHQELGYLITLAGLHLFDSEAETLSYIADNTTKTLATLNNEKTTHNKRKELRQTANSEAEAQAEALATEAKRIADTKDTNRRIREEATLKETEKSLKITHGGKTRRKRKLSKIAKDS